MVRKISKGEKMNNKPKTTNESPELMKYKLDSMKKEDRKTMIIAILLTAIITFGIGFIASDMFNRREINLEKENNSLKIENTKVQAEISQLKEQAQNNQK